MYHLETHFGRIQERLVSTNGILYQDKGSTLTLTCQSNFTVVWYYRTSMKELNAKVVGRHKEFYVNKAGYDSSGVYFCHGHDANMNKTFLDHIEVIVYGKFYNLVIQGGDKGTEV